MKNSKRLQTRLIKASGTSSWSRLREAVQSLVGMPCWAVVGGPGTGTVISLDFGAKIRRSRKLKNPFLGRLVRTYSSEISVFVAEATWRVEMPDRVLCTSTSSNHSGGKRNRSLKKLVGQRVEKATIHQPSGDLFVEFDNGCVLRVFCDQANELDEIDNYTVFTQQKVYTVGPWSDVTVKSV